MSSIQSQARPGIDQASHIAPPGGPVAPAGEHHQADAIDAALSQWAREGPRDERRARVEIQGQILKALDNAQTDITVDFPAEKLPIQQLRDLGITLRSQTRHEQPAAQPSGAANVMPAAHQLIPPNVAAALAAAVAMQDAEAAANPAPVIKHQEALAAPSQQISPPKRSIVGRILGKAPPPVVPLAHLADPTTVSQAQKIKSDVQSIAKAFERSGHEPDAAKTACNAPLQRIDQLPTQTAKLFQLKRMAEDAADLTDPTLAMAILEKIGEKVGALQHADQRVLDTHVRQLYAYQSSKELAQRLL